MSSTAGTDLAGGCALAAEADFVICLYNPISRSRTAYLAEAAKLIQQHRKPETPVGIVRNAGREGERAWITTLEKLPEEPVDMFCVVWRAIPRPMCRTAK